MMQENDEESPFAQNDCANLFGENFQPEVVTIKMEPFVDQVKPTASNILLQTSIESRNETKQAADHKAVKQEPPMAQVKRGRGRPRKGETVIKMPKRPRGRPRKDGTVGPPRYKGYKKKHIKAEPTDSPFCALCLRSCTQELVEEWNDYSKNDGPLQNLELISGMQIDLAKSSVCRTCWKLVEMLDDFRTCCQKAAEWANQHAYGLSVDDEESTSDRWFSGKTLRAVERIAEDVRARTNRLTEEWEPPQDISFDVADSPDGDLGGNFDSGDDVKPTFEDFQQERVDQHESEPKADFKDECLKEFLRDALPDETDEEQFRAEKLEITVLECSKCRRRFDSKTGHGIHIQMCKATETKDALVSCSICSANFLSQASLRAHMNKHKGIKPYICRKKCKNTFYTADSRRSHETNCGVDGIICPICGLHVKTATSLASHHAYRHGNAKLPCPICGKVFKARKSLQKHKAVHSDARKYPCHVCGKGFKSAWTVKVHMRIHTLEKPFSCGICGQGYAYKCLLKSHMQQAHSSFQATA